MPSAELTEWWAFYLLEPFGQDRSHDGARLLASMLYNINRGTKPVIDPSEFLKNWQPKTIADAEAGIARLAALLASKAAEGQQ